MYTLAIETGGTKLQMAIGNDNGEILFNHRQRVVPSLGNKGTLETIESSLPMLREKAEGLGGGIKKISVGFGGIVDSNRGVLIASEQISGWNQFPLRDYLTEKTGIPTYVINDADAATWGEYKLGTGKDSHIFMYTNIGSGIGGGLVTDGKLYNGHGFGAVEIGQTYVYDTESDGDYPFIQLERLCSGWGIEMRMRRGSIPADSLLWQLCEHDQSTLTCEMLGTAVKANDFFATSFFDNVTHTYSLALANAINLLGPEVVAIGGGVSLIGDPLLSRINEFTERYVANNSKGHYKIVKSQLGEEIVLVGALLLAGSDNRL